ncbi:hypothetical protein ACX3O0_01325 [Homoserinimonas sp. A447]
MRKEIDTEMRTFARRMPEYHSVLMAGLLHDTISTLDTDDPFRRMYRDGAGIIRISGGEAFGSWHNATDMMPASHADIGRDISLAPMTEPLSDESVEIFFRASHSWERTRDYLEVLSLRNKTLELNQHVFEAAEDAIRWGLLRRQAYALDDGFFPLAAKTWANRVTRIVNGEPFDEARMLRLRSGSATAPGTYEALTKAEDRGRCVPVWRVGESSPLS